VIDKPSNLRPTAYAGHADYVVLPAVKEVETNL